MSTSELEAPERLERVAGAGPRIVMADGSHLDADAAAAIAVGRVMRDGLRGATALSVIDILAMAASLRARGVHLDMGAGGAPAAPADAASPTEL